jgi:hypothetical protein
MTFEYQHAGHTQQKGFSPFAVGIFLVFGLILGILFGFQASHVIGVDESQVYTHLQATKPGEPGNPHKILAPASQSRRVLVLYSFYDGDEVSWGNLLFFVKHAISPGDGVAYIIILNGLHSLQDRRLPELPHNARFVLHQNECYDWGTYSWALQTQVQQQSFTCVLLETAHYSNTPKLLGIKYLSLL